ncbi:DMT family transporter [Sneathiella sp.]|uniref:DMT family transporter n=1 Tax=Sneathiella sp. TaxID=1964365 RepID=UPI002637B608|nr:DMT family transporter [Sneathiella sp.]MDF2367394.1 DMT family transporter [Sneathiella sp.]
MVLLRVLIKPFLNFSPVLQAAGLMVFACLVFSMMGGIIRYVSDSGMPVFQVVFLRNVAGILFFLPWFFQAGLGVLKTDRIGAFGLRSMLGFASMLSWFYAVSVLPLADAVALNFTAPIFGTILAIVVLHEVVGIRRGVAMIVGFIGAMIILRPGLTELSVGSYSAIFSAITMAGSMTMVKLLSRTESTAAMVALNQILIIPMSLVPAIFVWQTPTIEQLIAILVIGLLATAGHLSFTKAYTLADASIVMPFDFFRLIFSALIGFIFFMQEPDLFTYIGAAIIFASSIYIAIREARVSNAQRKEILAQTKAETRSGPAK